MAPRDVSEDLASSLAPRSSMARAPSVLPVVSAASEKIARVSWTLGRQMAVLFLGAVAFAVAMSWNSAVQSLIQLWTPKDARSARLSAVKYEIVASVVLTVAAVCLAAMFTWVYGDAVHAGQAMTYGLT